MNTVSTAAIACCGCRMRRALAGTLRYSPALSDTRRYSPVLAGTLRCSRFSWVGKPNCRHLLLRQLLLLLLLHVKVLLLLLLLLLKLHSPEVSTAEYPTVPCRCLSSTTHDGAARCGAAPAGH